MKSKPEYGDLVYNHKTDEYGVYIKRDNKPQVLIILPTKRRGHSEHTKLEEFEYFDGDLAPMPFLPLGGF